MAPQVPGPDPRSGDTLPVRAVLDQVRSALGDHGAAVLVAPPGSGKTTVVPVELTGEEWATGRIVVLEPRRMAARLAAAQLAARRGEPVGDSVGYAVRGDRRRGPRTRVEVVTEGLFLRRLQRDPGLEGVSAVLLDEFHERSLDADVALAMLLDVRAALRPDLRLLVMSATLDAGPVAALLGGDGGDRPRPAPVVTTEVASHPVTTRYRPGSAHDRIEDRVAEVVVEALAGDPGDVLVFLPGRAEIRGARRALARRGVGGEPSAAVAVHELHGTVPLEDQERALRPDPDGRRRVVLATSVAESSVTVAGVRVVVDAGRRRTVRGDPRTGLPALVTGPVSRAGADQRRGRAGRTAPGVCYRLWAETDERHRPVADRPEILDGDLAPLVLELRCWGAGADDLHWLDPPPDRALAVATRLLVDLGAMTDDGRPTTTGRRLAALGVHPRLGAVALALGPEDPLAAQVAAVLEVAGPGEVDVVERVRALQRGEGSGDPLREALRLWRRALGGSRDRRRGNSRSSGRSGRRHGGGPAGDGPARPGELGARVGAAVLAGFPDRLARRRRTGRTDDRGRPQAVYQLCAGGEVALPHPDHPLGGSEWLVVTDLDLGDGGRVGRVHAAVAVDATAVAEATATRVQVEDEVGWSRESRDVRAVRRRRLGAVVLDEQRLARPPADQVRAALEEGLRQEGLDLLPGWSTTTTLRRRLRLLRAVDAPCPGGSAWPDASDGALVAGLDDWLGPALEGVVDRSGLARVDVAEVLCGPLPWVARRALDELAPREWELPGGRRAPLRYEEGPDGVEVVLAVRLQQLLGLDVHPRVAGGRVPVVVELLSPAGRPVQRTTDLPGFWRGSYAQVRSELRGRYPKHPWPERPWEAAPPTTRSRRR